MLVVGDLGFQILVLAACLVFPVFGIVLRRKWRLGMARTEEINRLLVLASEEAARVEIEASFGCTAAPISLNLHCAVCLSPTTTRCARCKAVRYCSGKCQIIHWRQGHKTECHPPKTSDWSLEKENDYGDRIANQHHSISYDNKFGIENGQHIEPDEVLYDKLTLPSSDDSVKNVSVELHADEEENSTTEFADATSNTESSDDASRSENSSESCSPRSDGYLSAQNSFDKDDSTSRLSIVDPNKPLSPNYAHLVNSVDKFAKRKTENHPAFVGIDPVYDNHSRAAEVRSIDGSCEAASSSFQEHNGNSIRLKDGVHDDSVPSSINGAKNKKIPGSHSFLHFSFSVSGGTPSDAQVAQVNGNVADGSLRTTSGINRTAGSNLQSDINIDSSEVRNSPSSCEGSGDKDNTVKELSDHPVVYLMISSSPRISPFPAVSKCESRSVRVSNTSMSAPLKSERSCPVFIQPDNSKIISKHSGNGSVVNDSSVHLPTISSRESVPPTDSRKVGPTQVGAGVSSLDANFSRKSAYGFRPFALNEIKSKSDHSYVANDSENAGKYNYKGHFPFELLVDLYNWNKVELQPSGLVNCGNSCYANVVLQCLIFTPPLTAYFLQGLHSKACIQSATFITLYYVLFYNNSFEFIWLKTFSFCFCILGAKERWCFTCEFESLILEAKEGKSPLSPFRIISQLRKIGSQLVNGKEEDAHEFLRCAIDTMQSICSMEAQVSRSGPMEEETTLIGFTFGGYLLSKIKCTRCENKSERIERILDLTVEISGDIETIEEALQQYTSIEILDGDNRYQCGRCKSYVKANKRLSILEAPNILTIALKRFQSGKFGKLNKPVIFSEILDLAPYMSSRSDKSPEYRLYGVIVHLDVMNAAFSGHYVCYIRNNQNKWFKIDDSTVTAVEFENVLTRGAYMLFYARCSPRAPRLIRTKVMTDSKEGCIPSLISGRSTSFKPSPNSTYPDSQNPHIYNNSSNDSSNISSFYRKFHQLQKLLEDDLTSDSSSLLSSNSDESSCSTNSSSDSTSTEDLPEYIYSDSGCGWNDSSQYAPVGAKTTESRPARPYQTNGISNLTSRRESTCREKAMHSMEDKKNGWR